MKRIIPVLMLAVLFMSCETLSKLPGYGYGTTVTEFEAKQGIEDALAQGVTTAIFQLNRQDGFFGDEFYKILLPPDAQKVESTLRNIGLGKQVDKAVLQINRAAEDAVSFAKPIFTSAIKEMTIADALSIIKGSNDAATNYFREKTRIKLVDAFKPSIQGSLDKLEATRYYADIINLYNKLPTTGTKINPDLTGYVVERATDALFNLVAKEEANIRANPVARTTEILKKVFGARL
ncbi:MAG: DUF4197 domain-containing protein [Chitinophagaceae bacterium]|nr:DUF4197 domain-containing protein [Chitinophagaceae bacterium]